MPGKAAPHPAPGCSTKSAPPRRARHDFRPPRRAMQEKYSASPPGLPHPPLTVIIRAPRPLPKPSPRYIGASPDLHIKSQTVIGARDEASGAPPQKARKKPRSLDTNSRTGRHAKQHRDSPRGLGSTPPKARKKPRSLDTNSRTRSLSRFNRDHAKQHRDSSRGLGMKGGISSPHFQGSFHRFGRPGDLDGGPPRRVRI